MRPLRISRTRIAGALTATLVAALALVVLPGGPAAGALRPDDGAPPPTAAQPAASPERSRTVMLLTGDRVTYSTGTDGRHSATISPASRPGGTPVTFTTSVQGDHYYVIPSDAAPRISAGVLDRGLFDVPLLVRDGQATADRPAGVILRYRKGVSAARHSRTLPAATRGPLLGSINGAAVRPERGQADRWWQAVRGTAPAGRTLARGIARVSLDSVVRPSLDVSVIQTGAPAAWAAGYRGEGIKVAVLDTGIDATHPDVAGRIVASANFTAESSIADGHGHGTHVASTVAGNGAASAERFRGMAPAASLMVGKVLDSAGNGATSQVIAGMEWAARGGARVVNLSLGSAPTDGTDPASQAVDALTAETGALFVIAAGNNGGDASVNAPGAATSALTVGATDKIGGLSDFSNRGPRRGDAAVKPELTAPGYQITAARAAGTSMGTPYDSRYTSASGTSMATPHVAGAAALLAQAHPAWTAAQLKKALVSTADPRGHPVFTGGGGWLDVRRALNQKVYGPVAVAFGAANPPHTGTRTRELSYRNDTTAPVTLNLSITGQGWDGRALPTGAVTTSAATLTIPAGAKGTATLTANLAPGDPGVYGGVVTASTGDGAVRVLTPFSYYKSNAHALTVPVLDSRGTPAPDVPVTLARLDGATGPNDPLVAEAALLFSDADGMVRTQVADGVYDVYATIFEWRADGRRATLTVATEKPVRAATTITLDARQARRVNPTLPEATNTLVGMVGTLRGLAGGGQVGAGPGVSWENYDVYVTPTPAPTTGWLDAYEQWTLGSAQIEVRANGTRLPVDYHPYLNGRTLARYGSATLPVVYAGAGSAAELAAAGVAGKVALVRVTVPTSAPDSGGQAWYAIDAARVNARAAGAAGVLAYIDVPNGVAMPVRDDDILALTLPAAAGQALRAQVAAGPVQLAISGGRANPERVFQLRFQHDDGIPATSPAVDPTRLVSYPARYRADRDGLTYLIGWPVLGPHDRAASALAVGFWAPMVWTEYVGPGDARLTWSRSTTQKADLDSAPDGQLDSRDVFRPGDTRGAEEWFLPPVRTAPPEPPDGYPYRLRCTFCREGDTFVAGYYQVDSDPRHYGATQGAGVTYRLFRADGTEIPAAGTAPYRFPMAVTAGGYRLDAVETQRGLGSVRTLGQRISTSWTFQSARQASPGQPAGYRCFTDDSDTASCQFQPLVQLRYQLDLDLLNRTPAGEAFTFDVVAGAHRAVPGAAAATTLTLSSSTNGGATWQPAQVTAVGSGRFRVTVTHPPLASTDGYVWLRTEATDAAGNRVTQTVERAYALRPPLTSCRVRYTANSWGTGFTADVSITNTASTVVNGWTLAWTFAGNQRVTNAWNGVASQTGQRVSVTNAASNATISPGGSVSFGFQGTYSGTNTDPVDFTLNGGPCVRQ